MIRLEITFESLTELLGFTSQLKGEVKVTSVVAPEKQIFDPIKKELCLPKIESLVKKKQKLGLTKQRKIQLRELCSQGLSLADIAKQMGVSRQSISLWKKKLDLSRPTKSIIKTSRVIKCYNIECNKIIEGAGFTDAEAHVFCDGKCYRDYMKSKQRSEDTAIVNKDEYVAPIALNRQQFEIHFDTKQILCKYCGAIGILSSKFMDATVRKEIDAFKKKHHKCHPEVNVN